MKYAKYLSYILLTLMLIPTGVFAQGIFQTSKGIVCGSTDSLMKGLQEVGETEIILLGKVDNIKEPEQVVATLHRNNKTGTFSVIETANMGISCMISSGTSLDKKEEDETKPKPEKKEVPKAVPEKDGGTKTLLQPSSGGIAIKFTISQ